MRGIDVKLCRGGGQDVAHSRELACPHGSSAVAGSPCRDVMYTFQRKNRVDAPRMNAPTVEIWFSVVARCGRSGEVAIRRGMPMPPSQCWTRNVMWNPMNKVQKCHPARVSLSFFPVNFGHQK